MDAKSTLLVIDIDTPGSKITLLNAAIVNVIHPVLHYAPKGGRSGKKHNPFELTEVEMTFATIIHKSKSGKKGFTDNWSLSG